MNIAPEARSYAESWTDRGFAATKKPEPVTGDKHSRRDTKMKAAAVARGRFTRRMMK
jgi:hypothetical protein